MKLNLNNIYNEDCMEGMRKIPDKSVALVIADPPYGISRTLNTEGKRLGRTAKLSFNFGEWDVVNNKWFELALNKTNGWIISFCAKKDIGSYWEKLERNKFIAIDAVVWQKPDPLPLNSNRRFVNAWEAIIVGKRPGTYWGSKYEHNVIKFQAPKNGDRIHPTQKPLGLIKHLIKLTTQKGNIVLDPFMGSGTTAVACVELERHYIGFEISKKYHKEAINRIKAFMPNQVFGIVK